MSLSGDVWPIHFSPEDGESLSSWFARLSVFHFQVPSTFFSKTVLHRRDAWKQDIDVTCPPDVITALGNRCCQRETTLLKSTLGYWRKNFDPYDGQSTALPRWISPTLIRRNSIHHRGCKICPLCLKSNAYYRLFWRFSFYFVCPIHKVCLIDSCQQCNMPITSHKIHKSFRETFPLDSLAYCHNCQFNYCSSRIQWANPYEIRLVNKCIKAVLEGHTSFGNLHGQYSHLYFQGLRLIAKGMLNRKLKSFVENFKSSDDCSAEVNLSRRDEIEFIPVNQFRRILVASYWVSEEWPYRFLKLNDQFHLNHSDWMKPRDVIPFWIRSVINW